jgi:hypothetical protein
MPGIPRAYQLSAAVALLAIALTMAYCSGQSAGQQAGRMQGYTAAKRELAQQIAVTEAKLEQRAAAVARESQRDSAARAAHATVRRRVAVVTDSSVSIDGGPPVPALPPLVDVVRSSDELHRRDDALLIAERAEKADLAVDRDLWKKRALICEEQLARTKPPRFGFMTGLGLGATLAAALVAVF